MSISDTLKKFSIEQSIKYLYKDPEKNLRKLIDWADKFSEGKFIKHRKMIRQVIEDPNNPYYPFIRHIISDIEHDVMSTIAVNFTSFSSNRNLFHPNQPMFGRNSFTVCPDIEGTPS